MKPKRKLIQIFSLMLTGVSLVSILLIGALWISFETNRSGEESLRVREDYIAAHEATINLETNRICDYMEAQRQSGEIRFMKDIRDHVYEAYSLMSAAVAAETPDISREHVQEVILSGLKGMALSRGRIRYFISTTTGQEVSSDEATSYEKLDILTSNVNSNYSSPSTFMEIVGSLGLIKEGFFRYNLVQDLRSQGDDDLTQVAYLKIFEPYQWIVGASAHPEDYTREVQNDMIDWAANMAMPNENYLMIITYDGDVLVHPEEKMVGLNIFTDAVDNTIRQKVMSSMIRGAKERNKDLIRYTGVTESGSYIERMAYFRAIPAWNWVVVTWVNFNDLEAVMAERQAILTRNVQSQILRIIVISISMLAVVMILSKVLSSLATRSFSAFFSFFEAASTASTEINPDEQPFEEFARLAVAANDMISQRVRAENDKLALLEKLSRSTKMEAMGLMAAEVAHDLNNILSGIIGYPQLLLMEENITARQKEALREILETGQRAAAVVSDLLTIARGVASTKVSLPVNSAVTDYTGSPECRQLLEIFPNVKLNTDLSPGAGNIMASSVHLTKVIMNLVSNAFEAMPADKADSLVTVKTESRELCDRAITYDDQLEPGRYAGITVSDNGPGIPADDLNKIFEPFYSKKMKGRSGTGLGLAIVWNTVKDHQGHLDVQSGPAGTVFTIYIRNTEEKAAAPAVPAKKCLTPFSAVAQPLWSPKNWNGNTWALSCRKSIGSSVKSGWLKRRN